MEIAAINEHQPVFAALLALVHGQELYFVARQEPLTAADPRFETLRNFRIERCALQRDDLDRGIYPQLSKRL